MLGYQFVDDGAVVGVNAIADAALVDDGLPHAAVVGDADEHWREDVAYGHAGGAPHS